MNLEGILDYLRRCGHFPLAVQVGGYGKRDYPFVSRQARPYERSFSIQGDKVVVMGWPIRGKPFQQPPATPSAWVQEQSFRPVRPVRGFVAPARPIRLSILATRSRIPQRPSEPLA